MIRRLFILVSAISLLLCLASLTLWVSTYFGSFAYSRAIVRETGAEFRPIHLFVWTGRGEVGLLFSRYHVSLKNLSPGEAQEVTNVRRGFGLMNGSSRWSMPYDRKPQRPTLLAREGFEFEKGTFARGVIRVSSVSLSTPCWFLTLVLLLMPAAWWIIRTRRLLRAAPEGGHSANLRPELGIVLGKHAAAGGRFLCVASVISLLLCIVTIVGMRLTETTGRQALFTTAGGTLMIVRSHHNEISLTMVGDWPEREPLGFRAVGEDWPQLLYPFREWMTGAANFSLLGFTHLKGITHVFMEWDETVMLLPYGYNNGGNTVALPFRRVQFSLRELALVLAVLPAYWTVTRVRRRIRRQVLLNQGMCGNCGYNLRGNTSGICPECGATVGSRSVERANGGE